MFCEEMTEILALYARGCFESDEVGSWISDNHVSKFVHILDKILSFRVHLTRQIVDKREINLPQHAQVKLTNPPWPALGFKVFYGFPGGQDITDSEFLSLIFLNA